MINRTILTPLTLMTGVAYSAPTNFILSPYEAVMIARSDGVVVSPTNFWERTRPGASEPDSITCALVTMPSVTNHLLMCVGGALIDYWSDGSSVWSKQVTP